jgi:hypothetical protein
MATTQKKIRNPRHAIKKTKRVLHPMAPHVSKPIVSKELTHKTHTTTARRDFFKSLLGYKH